MLENLDPDDQHSSIKKYSKRFTFAEKTETNEFKAILGFELDENKLDWEEYSIPLVWREIK